MYVVGQYPRFLKQHWKFLRTVVNKLFEFMHETHPGVQDMSCDTFLKIALKCRNKFVITPRDENQPYILDILQNMPNITKKLETGQIHTFYQAVGEIIKAERDPVKQEHLLSQLMELPNQEWKRITGAAAHNLDILWDLKTIKKVILVLKTNHRVAAAVGPGYTPQLGRLYQEMLQVYKYYSDQISQRIQRGGPTTAKTVIVKTMRSVKKETLRLMSTFIINCPDSELEAVFQQFIPALMEPVLNDYKVAVADARDAEVMSLFTAVIQKLGVQGAVKLVPPIFDSVFQSTLDMITTNFEDYPDHRVMFFKLIQAILKNAFPAILSLNTQQCRLVVDSIVWAFKHLERNVAEVGLTCLVTLIDNISRSSVANEFFKSFYISLLQDLFGVLTDTFHKPGFKYHATLIAQFFQIVDTGAISIPLWDVNTQNFNNNREYVQMFVCNLLAQSFKNQTRQTIQAFVTGAFSLHSNLPQFKRHTRDFLIQLKEFSSADNKDLYLEEQKQQEVVKKQAELERMSAVPGLYKGN